MRRLIERHPASAAALFGAGTVALFLLCFTPTFDTNDDAVMMNTASGRAYGRPSEHLVFTSVVIGLALKLLYSLAPHFHWYGAYLYGLHAVGLALLFFAFLRPRPTTAGLLSLCVVLWYFEIHLLMRVQFTSAAMLLGASAILAFLGGAEHSARPRRLAVACGALLGLAGLVRAGALAAALSFAAPAIALGARRAGYRVTAWWLAAALFVTAAGFSFERASYHRDPAWSSFFAFNDLRGVLHSRLDHVADPTLAEIGWTRNDLAMFSNWYFFDPQVFSTTALTTLVKRDQGRRIDFLRQGAFRRHIEIAGRTLYDHWLTVALGLLFITLPLLTWRGALVAVATSATALFAFAGLLSFAHLPPRVAIPGILSWALIVAFTLHRERAAAVRGPRAWTAAGVGVLVLFGFALDRLPRPEIPGLRELRAVSLRNQAEHAALRGWYGTMQSLDPEGVYFVLADALPLEAALPFGGPLPQVHEFELGWPQRVPDFVRSLQSFGIDDPLRALVHRPHTYLLARPDWIAPWVEYAWEHYREEIRISPAAGLAGSNVTIYRAQSAVGD